MDQADYAFFDPPEFDGVRPPKKKEKKDGDRKSDTDVIDLFDLIEGHVAEPVAKIRLPSDIQKALKLEPVVEFRFLNDADEMPKKNTIVIVRHDNLKKGNNEYRLACGKILWSKQKDVETGDSGVLVSIRSKDTVKLKLSASEWETFRPLAVINE